jgi:hypothetical protein
MPKIPRLTNSLSVAVALRLVTQDNSLIATMASVTSLDKDMRKLRLDRYTPQAANEVRSFIEESLGEPLAKGDLLDSLKDGVALCKYDFSEVYPSPQVANILFADSSALRYHTLSDTKPRQ